jgi:RimJ/RimL family protein N-acetyltransferase
MKLVPIEQGGAIAVAADDVSGSVPEVLEQTVALYGRRGFHPPWIGYLATEQGTWVGTCGFAGQPKDGEVEVAYFTFPGQEGRGVATRMATELIAQTRAAAALSGLVYVAHTLPQESSSTRILRRLGFTLVGPIVHPEDGPVWKWQMTGSE